MIPPYSGYNPYTAQNYAGAGAGSADSDSGSDPRLDAIEQQRKDDAVELAERSRRNNYFTGIKQTIGEIR